MNSIILQNNNVKLVIRKILLIILLCFSLITYLMSTAHAESSIYSDNSLKSIKDQSILSSDEYYIYETELSYIFSNRSGKWGFYDKQTGFIQMPIYDGIYDLFAIDPSSPILVEQNKRIAYLKRSSGEIIIPFKYQYFGYCSEFYNGYAVVQKAEQSNQDIQTLLIDEFGNEIIFPFGLMPTSFVYNDTIVIMKENLTDWNFQYGLGKVDGTVLLAPRYDYIADFHEGFACVKKDYKWGHIDAQGNEIVKPIYDLLEEECGSEGYYFENGVAELLLTDGTILHINYSGQWVDEP